MKIQINHEPVRDMTPEEVAEYAETIREFKEAGPAPEERIEKLELENADLRNQVAALKKKVEELELQNGGSVKPGGDVPFDPVPSDPVPGNPDKPFHPTPGGGLTIGG